jgi:drug/metabolite transporter (DMT)-like permease
LKERLGAIGKIGCLLSVVGAVIIVLHAPEDKEVTSIDELLFYALQSGKNIHIYFFFKGEV